MKVFSLLYTLPVERLGNQQRCMFHVLVAMLAPYQGGCYNPCRGSAGVFVPSEKLIEERDGRISAVAVCARAPYSTTRRLAMRNLASRGIERVLGPLYASKLQGVNWTNLKGLGFG